MCLTHYLKSMIIQHVINIKIMNAPFRAYGAQCPNPVCIYTWGTHPTRPRAPRPPWRAAPPLGAKISTRGQGFTMSALRIFSARRFFVRGLSCALESPCSEGTMLCFWLDSHPTFLARPRWGGGPWRDLEPTLPQPRSRTPTLATIGLCD